MNWHKSYQNTKKKNKIKIYFKRMLNKQTNKSE